MTFERVFLMTMLAAVLGLIGFSVLLIPIQLKRAFAMASIQTKPTAA